MNNFIYENSTKTYFWKRMCQRIFDMPDQALWEKGHVCLRRGFHHGNGIYDEIMESLAKAEKNVIEFSGICENPTYEKVLEGAKLAKENEIDLFLPLGVEA